VTARGLTLIALASACLALVASGCGGGCGPDTRVARESDTLPEDFPKDIPVYPNAEFGKFVRYGGSGVVVWEAPDPVATVKEFYARELAAKGWRVSTYPGLAAPWMGDSGVTVIATGWGRRISFALGERGDKTAITAVLPRLK